MDALINAIKALVPARPAALGRVVLHLAAAAGVAAVAAAAVKAAKVYSRTLRRTELHGGHLVAEVLQAHGVRFLFTLIGGHISPVVVAAKQAGIRVVDVRHEVTAVFAADAVARLTGVCGVAIVTAGPGITNTITAVKNAQMAESPVLLLGGAAATLTKGRGALQDIEQLSVLRPIVKFAATVTRVCDIVPTLRTAMKIAMSGVPGPVFVELPIDVLYNVFEVESSMGLLERKRVRDFLPEGGAAVPDALADVARTMLLPEEAQAGGVNAYLQSKGRSDAPVFLPKDEKRLRKSMPWLVERYLRFCVHDIFAGAFESYIAYKRASSTGAAAPVSPFGPLPVAIPLPSASHIQQVAALVRKAKQPVLLVASQATLFDPAGFAGGVRSPEDLVVAIEALGIPTFLSGMARGLLGRRHDLFVRQNRKAALQNADLVILAGAVCDFRLDYGRSISRKARIVAINRGKAALWMNSDMFWSPHVASVSDPASFVVQLAAALRGKHSPSAFAPWVASLKKDEDSKEGANASKASEPAYGHDALAGQRLINPLAMLNTLEQNLPDNAILIGDGGDFVATAAYVVRPRGPLRWLDPGAFGTLGVGGGFALGAKLARPNSEVWLLWGDGSVGYSVAEFDTCLRHRVPIFALVGNDAAWSQIEREQVPILGDNVACPLAYTPYDDVARGYGGDGWTIRAPEDDFVDVIAKARAVVAAGKPALINALIGKTDFREGSISV